MAHIVESNRDILEEAYNSLDEELNQKVIVEPQVGVALQFFHNAYGKYLSAVSRQLGELTKAKKIAEYKTLNEEAAHYLKRKLRMELRVQMEAPGVGKPNSPPPVSDSGMKMLLPKRELPQFTGDVREWLTFWASFSEIDSDPNLSDMDKFHFLMQSTKEDTPARKLIQSFPFQGANYSAAITSLKGRFGRNNVLVKVYIRDLLQLVIEASSGKTMDFGELVTTLSSQIRNLETLGVTKDKCALVLYPVVECCLPSDVMQAWQRHPNYEEDLDKLITFLQDEVNRLTERTLAHFELESTSKKTGDNKSHKRGKGDVPTTSSFMIGDSGGIEDRKAKNACFFCENNHAGVDCRKALGMPHQTKMEILRKKKRCFNCLAGFHPRKACRPKPKCTICEGAHVPVMCETLLGGKEKEKKPEVVEKPVTPISFYSPPVSPKPTKNETASTLVNIERSIDIPMQTFVVMVHGGRNQPRQVRAVMDVGSQQSYMSDKLANYLDLKTVGKQELVHELFNGKLTEKKTHRRVLVTVTDLHGKNSVTLKVSTTNNVANHVVSPRDGPWIKQFAELGVTFTDVGNPTSPVEILIGNDYAAKLYTGRKFELPGGPAAMETKWGWVMSGHFPTPKGKSSSFIVNNLLNVDGLPLAALWEFESIGIRDPVDVKTREELELQTQEHFERTVVQLTDGRYQVSLPWLTGMKDRLQSNHFVAVKRLHAVTRDLEVKGYLGKYDELFRTWLADGLIEEDPDPEDTTSGHFLPHHAVIKLTSLTTPIRPVFDGSSKLKGRLSLNDCLDKGPNTLELIPQILTRFRLRKIGILADVKRAFQQIEISDDDRSFLRFLWWNNLQSQEQKVYRHKRVVFGVAPSPYLLGAVLRHHLNKTSGENAVIADKLLKSTYVDNTVLSVDNFEEAHKFQQVAISLLLTAKFDLRGWEFGPSENGDVSVVLGLIWNKREDYLSLELAKVSERTKVEPTLRHILGLVHSIFDPLGFVTPFTLQGKLLLRRCHTAKVGLDTSLEAELREDTLKWAAQIPLLKDCKVPRHVMYTETAELSFHIYCDASMASAATAVFLRRGDGGSENVFLLASKTKVAPKKKATIPRLELLACVMGAHLHESVRNMIGDLTIPATFWTDSSTALAWIRGSGPWAVFVHNCVDKVRKVTSISSWRHVPGKQNPADLPSRGCSARKLLESRWWEGPDWLRLPPAQWPKSEEIVNEDIVATERKKMVITGIATTDNNPLLSFLRILDYHRIMKAVAAWLFYKRKLKSLVDSRRHGTCNTGEGFTLNAENLDEAEIMLIKYIQRDFQLQPERAKKLNPFVDDIGIIRVRTRLTLEDDFSVPILLPDDNEFVLRLIRSVHENICHAGATTTVAVIREKFWVVKGRRTVRKVITKCWTCRRYSAKRISVPVAPLPRARTCLKAPFSVVGVDAAGPLFVKGGEKTWILLFTCATYRAVHLELVGALSTDGVIGAFRRFIAFRGRPELIYSDNATGFVAANKSFKRVDFERLKEFALVSRMDWRFIPPSSPWWGGWWERLIGLSKQLLRRILGNKVVHRGELEILMLEVMECMNNRPLTYMSENPDDPQPLTPNHFVRWSGNPTFPEGDLRDAGSTRAAFKRLQRIREAIRSRFRKEYLGFLRGQANVGASVSLKVGDVVLIEIDNQKRMDWPLGIVTELCPGRDGVVRLYRLKTRKGELLRPAQRLFLMEQLD